MDAILALDEGTSSARALVVDAEGAIVTTVQREISCRFPAPGEVEQDPEEIASVQLEVADEAMKRALEAGLEVRAIGITNQRETTVVWDKRSGRAVAPAIVWQDRRTTATCERLKHDGREAEIRRRTGLVLDPYFSATKIAWILGSDRELARRAAAGELAFGTIDSWIVHRLTTGKLHVTDASNASRTLLYDLDSGDFAEDLAATFGVPLAMMPSIVPSSGVIGTAEVGRLAGLPIAGIAGDQQAALFGLGCFRPGAVKNTYGTGCFMLMSTGNVARRSSSGLLTTVAWRIGDVTEFALEGSILVGGAAIQWLRDGLETIASSSDVEREAASVDSSEGLVFVPALTGLGAPHWDPRARGAILGISRGTTKAHLARATLEGLAFQVADLADAMASDSGHALDRLRVDGGAARNDLLLRIQADLMGVPIERAPSTEATALGAAYLAGLGVGMWRDRDSLPTASSASRRFESTMDSAERRRRRERWRRAVAAVRSFTAVDDES